jgi:hypothetical protein
MQLCDAMRSVSGASGWVPLRRAGMARRSRDAGVAVSVLWGVRGELGARMEVWAVGEAGGRGASPRAARASPRGGSRTSPCHLPAAAHRAPGMRRSSCTHLGCPTPTPPPRAPVRAVSQGRPEAPSDPCGRREEAEDTDHARERAGRSDQDERGHATGRSRLPVAWDGSPGTNFDRQRRDLSRARIHGGGGRVPILGRGCRKSSNASVGATVAQTARGHTKRKRRWPSATTALRGSSCSARAQHWTMNVSFSVPRFPSPSSGVV